MSIYPLWKMGWACPVCNRNPDGWEWGPNLKVGGKSQHPQQTFVGGAGAQYAVLMPCGHVVKAIPGGNLPTWEHFDKKRREQ